MDNSQWPGSVPPAAAGESEETEGWGHSSMPQPPYPAIPAPAIQGGVGESSYGDQPWMPEFPGGQPRRRSLALPFAVLGVLALLLVTFVAGCSVGAANGLNLQNSATGATGAAPTVVVPPSAQDLQQTIINVIRTVQPSVVEVVSQGGQGEGIGSGEIISKDGYIVTNDHVVDGFSSYTVNLASGQSVSAKLVGTDPQDDLAVLKISANNLQPINFADSSKVQVGQFAIALGSPLGLEQSATFGIVSALNRTAQEGSSGPAAVLTGLIQTSAPINPGNSGGALVDLQGQLIGIPTLGAANPNSGTAANGIGFAIPSDRVKFVTDQLIKNGRLVSTGQGFIGIRGQDVTPQLASAYNLSATSGVLVAGFVNDASGKSPAQQAGVKSGDIIIAVNGKSIADNGDLASALISQAPGTRVTLTVQRGSSQVKVSVTLGEKPANLQG